MPEALLEIGVEEVPARFMPGLLTDLKKQAEAKLKESRVDFAEVKTFGTPRRLTLYIKNIAAKQANLVDEVKGPAKNAPAQAMEGFAKSQGIKVSDLLTKKVGDRDYVFAKVFKKGIATEKILPELFPKIITSLYLPLSMRWGTGEFKFIRPIHWILALFNVKVINFKLAGIKSGAITRGHRFLGRNVKIKTSAEYLKILAKNHVIADQEERKEKIKKEVISAAKKAGGSARIDEDLLEEVTYLVEYPVALAGKFDAKYLSLPADVLITVMKKLQKYFPVFDKSGKLLSVFVAVVNGITNASVKEGSERVLIARLSDAKFFFDEDMKVHFHSRLEDLKKVVFYEKLGTVYDRTQRVIKLSEEIAKSLGLSGAQKENILKIAQLCKADLITHMVKEFTELEGVMGREYALRSGEKEVVARGISDHYLPRSPQDKLPTNIEGAVVAIADKIDALVGCFSIGMIPTGSEDPYGLRRQAYGIAAIIISEKLRLSLSNLIEKSYQGYSGQLSIRANLDDLKKKILGFIALRIRAMLLDEKIRYDVADAVLSADIDDLADTYARAKAVMRTLDLNWFKGVFYTGDRVARLGANAKRENVIEADFAEDAERNIYRLFLEVKGKFEQKVAKQDYEGALKELSVLTDPVEDFFKKIMVMVEDEKLKSNRLALLKTMENTYRRIADFTKLAM